MDNYDINRIATRYVLDELTDDEIDYILLNATQEDRDKIITVIQKLRK